MVVATAARKLPWLYMRVFALNFIIFSVLADKLITEKNYHGRHDSANQNHRNKLYKAYIAAGIQFVKKYKKRNIE